MDTVYSRAHQRVVVCIDCYTGIAIPAKAWDVAKVKRDSRWRPKPTRQD